MANDRKSIDPCWPNSGCIFPEYPGAGWRPGGNFNGSQLLKTEHVHRTYDRTFDSQAGVQVGNYSAYLPLVILRDPSSGDNLAVGWDYMGHWSLQVGGGKGERIGVALQVVGYDDELQPGAQ